jgi:hypothetical protein
MEGEGCSLENALALLVPFCCTLCLGPVDAEMSGEKEAEFLAGEVFVSALTWCLESAGGEMEDAEAVLKRVGVRNELLEALCELSAGLFGVDDVGDAVVDDDTLLLLTI